MGVYIKGMEMPTRCEDCFCYRHNAEYDYAYCNISSVNVLGNANARLNNCPLVPVPPHGRLIDADALLDSFDPSDFWNPDAEDNCFAAIHVVNCAPTIIQAEEGEE